MFTRNGVSFWNLSCFNCRVSEVHNFSGWLFVLDDNASVGSSRNGISVQSAVHGDSAALNELFVRCIPQLQRTAARFLNNQQDSEDALQDGLLSGVRHVSKFQGRAQFSTWMHTIVANAARSILRKQRLRPLIFSLDDPHPDHESLTFSEIIRDQRESLEGHFRRRERLELLVSLIKKLPPTHRSIICLCDLQELPMQEAAKRLGLTVSAAKTRHLRAMRFLSELAKTARERRITVLEVLSEQEQAARRAPLRFPRSHKRRIAGRTNARMRRPAALARPL